jgi:hypothetical protein
MSTALSEAERARRRQFVIDGKAASALGISMEAYHARHKAAIESWTTTIRARMDECGVDDPVEILPELLARLEEHAIGEARAAAKVAAREEVQRLLRKVVAP